MENKITKNLIILGAIVFTLAFANHAQAYCQRYAFSNQLVDRHCVEEDTFYSNFETTTSTNSNTGSNSQTTTSDTNVVNNYYYYPTTSKTTTSNTSTTKSNVDTIKDTSNNNSNYNSRATDYNYNNGLGASVYNSDQTGNGITALSLKGSGSFMPSSIWQWILVVFLILIIIVIARMFVTKPSPADHDTYVAHAH